MREWDGLVVLDVLLVLVLRGGGLSRIGSIDNSHENDQNNQQTKAKFATGSAGSFFDDLGDEPEEMAKNLHREMNEEKADIPDEFKDGLTEFERVEGAGEIHDVVEDGSDDVDDDEDGKSGQGDGLAHLSKKRKLRHTQRFCALIANFFRLTGPFTSKSRRQLKFRNILSKNKKNKKINKNL